jgi:SAM-dependent methyltransferase
MKDYREINKDVWNQLAESGNVWTRPVSKETVEQAKKGDWHIVLTPKKKVPRDWFPKEMQGLKILCLASGGGQQGPILAATGAKVTVLDYSPNQLAQDEMIAKRDGLMIKTVQGDMSNLSMFEDDCFDVIVHPWSNCFTEDVNKVWQEAYRVLKKGGILMSGFGNPLEYIFDLEKMNQGELVVKHTIPYSDLTSLTEEERHRLVLDQNEPLCFGHSLEDQIGGQTKVGFAITGFYEDVNGSMLDQYIKVGIATKAIKL